MPLMTNEINEKESKPNYNSSNDKGYENFINEMTYGSLHEVTKQ